MSANATAPTLDLEQRRAALRAEVDAVAQLLDGLMVQRGDITLVDDPSADAELARIGERIADANERRDALIDALSALERRQREERAAEAWAIRLRRVDEAYELSKALLTNDRTADPLAKKLARLIENRVSLCRRLAQYGDVHRMTLDQLDPAYAINSAFAAAGSRMLTDRLDLRPVESLAFAERSRAILETIERIRSQENEE